MSKEVFGFDVNFLKQVKTLFKETNIQEVEIEEGEYLYLRVSRKKEQQAVQAYAAPAPVAVQQAVQAPVAAQQQTPAQQAASKPAAQSAGQYDDEKKYFKIKSPIVGTFYDCPSPGSPSFVKTGDMVSPDTVVCIVEAMKVMNEIKAETKGKVVQVLKTGGSSIHANDVLFVIEKM